MELTQTLYDAYASLRSQISITPRAALILGTNLNPYASHIRVVQEIPFHSIRSFPTSSAPGMLPNRIYWDIAGHRYAGPCTLL